jgi:hypothetical protein
MSGYNEPFVREKCNMSGNSVLCLEVMKFFVGKKCTMSGNNEPFCLGIVYHSYFWPGGRASRISWRAAGLAGRSSEQGVAGQGA